MLYAVAILVGSVHLGWHYAIDGYVAAIMVWVIWMVSGRLVAPVKDAARDGSGDLVKDQEFGAQEVHQQSGDGPRGHGQNRPGAEQVVAEDQG